MFQKLRTPAFALLLAGATLPATAQVKIGSNPASITPSAALEVESTNGGFLPPRLTLLQLNAIVNPATSLMAWCMDCSPAGLRIYDGNAWTAFGTSGAANATFTASSLSCTGTLGGTYQQGIATTSANTKQVTIGIATGGSYTISTTPMNGVTFSGSGSTSTAGANPVTLTATGTPLAAGTFVYTVNASGQPSCTFSVTFTGQATFACGSIISSLPGTLTNGQAYNTGSVSIPYTAGNGQAYATTAVGPNSGLTLTRTAGTYASGGSGNVVYNLSGTYTGTTSGSVGFTLPESGCVVTAGAATYPGGMTLNCGGTLAGTYQIARPTDGTNTKVVTVSTVTTAGGYTITTATNNGVTFSGSGTFAAGASQPATLVASGTPAAAGTFSYTATLNGQTCAFSVAYVPAATFACGSATNTFSPQVITSSSTHSGTYTLAYTAGNGQAYGSVTLTQNGIAMTRAAGTYASGGGNVVYTFGGTHSGTNKAETFTLAEGCVVTVGCGNNIGSSGGPLVQMFYDNDGYGVNGAAVTPNYLWCAREVVVGSQTWLDRNLGADNVATSSTDNTSYGSLYQWGRMADGHQRESSTSRGIDVGTSATNPTLATTDQPANGDFILAPNTPYDWRSGQNNALWQGVSGTNNPCPSGFRLPTSAEMGTLTSGWVSPYVQTSATNTSSMGPIKMPLAGFRNSASGAALYGVGSYAYYWSSTVSGTGASTLYFTSGNLLPALADNRAYGCTVRCIKN